MATQGAGTGGTTGGVASSISGGTRSNGAGGANATGGTSSFGGSAGNAGASASGGEVASGGSITGSGGAETGGASSNSNTTGGTSGTGGTGGASSIASGGLVSVAGSASGGDGSAGSSAGCGIATADKVIFVSSALYTGNLGGLAGADAKCQSLADAAGLCGTYKAWLSDGTADASARLAHAAGNYVLPNKQLVASGWSGLISGTLQHAINLTETNAAASVGTVTCGGTQLAPVWTGAASNGIAVTNGSCSNWTSSGASSGGIFGSALATNSAWSGMCQLTAVCQSTAALYCVQQ